MSAGFWLSDRAWEAIEPLLPSNQPGARRVDDRRVISGIIHVLRVGCRWRDGPTDYGPATTIYNRFNRRRKAAEARPDFHGGCERQDLRDRLPASAFRRADCHARQPAAAPRLSALKAREVARNGSPVVATKSEGLRCCHLSL